MRSVSSAHFTVYFDSAYPPAGVMNDLESLHAKLLLDLLNFAPWAQNKKIDVFIYKDAATYRSRTGVTQWAGGHVDVARRAIHMFSGPHFRRVMAHEMAHLFLQDFFKERDATPPAWLNEGLACLMEWDYGMETPQHMPASKRSRDAEPLESLFRFDYHHEVRPSDAMADWYGQSYSVVRFMLRRFQPRPFFVFCQALRDGTSMDPALLRAYGLQMANTATLERLWKENLIE